MLVQEPFGESAADRPATEQRDACDRLHSSCLLVRWESEEKTIAPRRWRERLLKFDCLSSSSLKQTPSAPHW